MKISLRFLIPVVLLFWSCSKSEEPVPAPECLLLEKIQEFEIDTLKWPKTYSYTNRERYTYDKNYNITRIDYMQETVKGTTHTSAEFKYNKKNQLVEGENSFGRFVNEYDKQGRLVKQTRFRSSTEKTSNTVLAYNNRNELLEVKITFVEYNGLTTLKYRYVDGNPVYIEEVSSSGKLNYWDLTYDRAQIPNKSQAYLYFNPYLPPSVNNLQSIKMNTWSSPRIFTHTYTEKGQLATTSISNFGEEILISYIYECR